MNELEAITAGGAAMLLLELIKYLVRQAVGNQVYDFPAWVYVVGPPVLGFLVGPGLAWLGLTEYTIPADWLAWVKDGVIILLSAWISYSAGLKPLKEYSRSRLAGIVS